MKSICGVEGVRAWGVKEGKYGLAVIHAGGSAAGVFTRNLVRAAPITLMEERCRKGCLEAVVANSGCANAFTGPKGYEDAEEMARIAGKELDIEPELVGVASTGVIGRYLNLPLIADQCRRVVPNLEKSERAESLAATAIMTTDITQKHALALRSSFSIGGITKGSGMIAPNMGTMIAFIYTDAKISPRDLQTALQQAAARTFNQVVVDGDTSTNDIALCVATGACKKPDPGEFQLALEECCRSLAIQIAADGEGATKLIEIEVSGAPDEEAAARIARTIAGSPLVKTAVYGEDPNWGRVIAAAGRAGVDFDPDRVSLGIGEGGNRVELVREGKIVVDLIAAKVAMQGKKVRFDLSMKEGNASATAWGCDLTERYVEINGRYTT
ncbi:MAG: bifunctional glutamate N-acetyltransferase/amino-acid acetyltransferase ArgJ [Methanoregulaceae archaeon]|nr:bifunctional glutamate N-acetyltransferase/amino-acid acetyltransferase ArgJ [Methanoregulaceae archaeon]